MLNLGADTHTSYDDHIIIYFMGQILSTTTSFEAQPSIVEEEDNRGSNKVPEFLLSAVAVSRVFTIYYKTIHNFHVGLP
jgi:hypothetical protein